MKRMLRSTFDPLPRSLSTRGLVALVLVVVLGTAVTVHRYMESSDHSRSEVFGQGRSQSKGASFEVRGVSNGSRASSLGTRCRSSSACEAGVPSGTGGTTPAPVVEPTSASPSIFESN